MLIANRIHVRMRKKGDSDMRRISVEQIELFRSYLENEEKAVSTVEKYIRDVYDFRKWLEAQEVSKPLVVAYKTHLCARYATASVNSVLSSLNSLFCFCEWHDLRVKAIRIQKLIFASGEKELFSKTSSCH